MMRKVIRGLILSILGVIILLTLYEGLWGMGEIISSWADANNEQVAEVSTTKVLDPQATINAISTALVEEALNESDCSVLPDPIENKGKIIKEKKQFILIMTIEYAQDPANCFLPHPTKEGWYIAGWTEVTVGDNEPNDENTWVIYDSHAIREWDGKTIVVGADIFLERIGNDFTSLWAEYQNDYSALSWKVHIEDSWGHSLSCRLIPDDEDTCPE